MHMTRNSSDSETSSRSDNAEGTTASAQASRTTAAMRTTQELTELLRDSPVVAVCESNNMRNVGDHWSAVGRSVQWVERLGRTISLYEAASLQDLGKHSPLQGKLVIIGGSGLVGPGRFESCVESILDRKSVG